MLIHDTKKLAMAIKIQRKALKLTQNDISKLTGLKQATISSFENNPQKAKLDTLFRILSAVELDIQVFPKNSNNTNWQEEW